MTDMRLLMVVLLLLTTSSALAAQSNNLQMDGALVFEPCTLDSTINTLEVDFGTVIKKGLYKDHRTYAVPFVITLTDCDTSLGKIVNLMLSGPESKGLPGYLATTGAGSSGIAVGIETPEGKLLPINQLSPAYKLQDNATIIPLQAYVEAEPDAIKNQTLVAGDFSATATLEASYP